MDQLRRFLLNAPVVERGDYEYFVHPISDGVPMLKPGLFREIVTKIIRKADLESVDRIVILVAMGIHISTAVSLIMSIPLVIIRKCKYGLDGEMSLHQQTSYSEGDMSTDDVNGGDRVLIFDGVLSTDGVMETVLDALDRIDADVVNAVAIIKKAGPNEFGDSDHHIRTLISVTVEDGEVVIIDKHGDD